MREWNNRKKNITHLLWLLLLATGREKREGEDEKKREKGDIPCCFREIVSSFAAGWCFREYRRARIYFLVF